MKILVIDDDPDIIEIMVNLFEIYWSEANMLTAGDGTNGLAIVSREDPDLVILDLGLPDMDGFDVLAEIRKFSNVPVVILTVRGSEKDTTRALDLGADDYINKPFSHLVLLARVQAVHSRSLLNGKARRAWGKALSPDRTEEKMERWARGRYA